MIFLMVVFLASVAEYFLEREAQPTTFGNVPAALWWATVTMTTTGYGDVVPMTPLGRFVAAMVMISGLGVFGLWTGILATGFAAETRRDNFLKTWESVSKVPFFAALGPAAIADVTNMLRTMDLPPRTMIIRKGQQGDCMYFIAAGEVEVDLPGGNKVPLGEGAFFGEMALLGNNPRNANITTTRVSQPARARPRRLPPVDGAASGTGRDHRRGSQAARTGKQIRREIMSDLAGASAPLLDISGRRATIRLNRPKHHNRLEADDLGVLQKLFERVEADPALRVLVLTGTGEDFLIGLRSRLGRRARGEREGRAERRLRIRGGGQSPGKSRRADHLPAQWQRLWRLDRSGAACDFRIGVDTAEMFMPAAKLGLHYYKSGIQRYVSRLGVDNAKNAVPDRAENLGTGNAADRLPHRDGTAGSAR